LSPSFLNSADVAPDNRFTFLLFSCDKTPEALLGNRTRSPSSLSSFVAYPTASPRLFSGLSLRWERRPLKDLCENRVFFYLLDSFPRCYSQTTMPFPAEPRSCLRRWSSSFRDYWESFFFFSLKFFLFFSPESSSVFKLFLFPEIDK